VLIVGRNEERVAKAVKDVGGGTIGVIADVSRLADIDKAFENIRQSFGYIDVLFENAGIAKFAPIEYSDEALFDELTSANFKGAFFTLQR
jgi:NAD(P)-dependent dehydrogenase (short-subunit alcohol dehydrogenase family)